MKYEKTLVLCQLQRNKEIDEQLAKSIFLLIDLMKRQNLEKNTSTAYLTITLKDSLSVFGAKELVLQWEPFEE
jgi:hypothetical protein